MMTIAKSMTPLAWIEHFTMSEREFQCFSDLIYAHCGIHLPPVKRTMLTARLSKRLRTLGMSSFQQYYDYLCTPEGRSEEWYRMIDAVTTNKTEFFREAKHFDFLRHHVLPELTGAGRRSVFRKLHVWSAGCATGEEPYTLAMVMKEFMTQKPGADFSILATDISTRVLEIARQGLYSEERVRPVPVGLQHKYLVRVRDAQEVLFRIVAELRRRITFQYLNLVDAHCGLNAPMDIIFCRNVIIYFDRRTQTKLFEALYARLNPGGYLFIGHSETLHGITDRFIHAAASVYRKPV